MKIGKAYNVKNIILLNTLVLFFSCANNNSVSTENIEVQSVETQPDSNRVTLDCIKRIDTVFGDKSIKAIVRNNEIKVLVSFNDKDTVLPYSFDCSTPNGLIPSLYSYNENTICLERGAGQHYRELLIIQENNNALKSLSTKGFIYIDLQKALIVSRNEDNRAEIVFDYYNADKKKTYSISDDFSNNEVLKSYFDKNKFIIEFVGIKEKAEIKVVN